jgi:ribosome-binding ATPase YchF (GTP1/OBG family)
LGILGLPQSGKSTLFEILVASAPSRTPGARKDQVGVLRVPDARVDRLSGMYAPKKTTYATLEVVD